MVLVWAFPLTLHFWGKTQFLRLTVKFFNPYRSCGTPHLSLAKSLPAIMGKRLVRFGHAVHVFFFLDRRAATVGRIEQFVRKLVHHAFFAALTRIAHDPADSQRGAPVRIHFHRHLVVGSAYAAGLHFQHGLGIFHGLLEQLQGLVAAL